MNKGGNHLSYDQRILIEEMSKEGIPVTQIATGIGCARATIYREYKRGGAFQEYSAKKAQMAVGTVLSK